MCFSDKLFFCTSAEQTYVQKPIVQKPICTTLLDTFHFFNQHNIKQAYYRKSHRADVYTKPQTVINGKLVLCSDCWNIHGVS